LQFISTSGDGWIRDAKSLRSLYLDRPSAGASNRPDR